MEVDCPERINIELSELSDYPPRIVVSLSPNKEISAPALLEVIGLKDECCFSVANDCLPSKLDANIDQTSYSNDFVDSDLPDVNIQFLQVIIVLVKCF